MPSSMSFLSSMITSTHENQTQNNRKKVSRQGTIPLSIPMETQLESRERGGEWNTFHEVLTQNHSSVTWSEQYKMETQLESGGKGGEWNTLHEAWSEEQYKMETQSESGGRGGGEWNTLHEDHPYLTWAEWYNMETQLESGGRGGEWNTFHQALTQDHPSLTWSERYKMALEMATYLAFLHPHETLIHAHGAPLKSPDIFMGSPEPELRETTNWRCVESFGKLLYALISAKESGAAKLPSSMVGDRRLLGRAEYVAFRAAVWLRRHMIPALPWACPLRRYYILNGEDLDERMRDEIMASGRAIVQLGAAVRVVIQCTQDDPGSRPTMAEVYKTLEAANCCEIPWSLTTALAIGFPLYRSLALLVYLVVFLYVGIYKSLGLLVFYFPYALGVHDSPGYDPFDALLLLFSILALMWVVLKTVCSFNRLDDVLYLDE